MAVRAVAVAVAVAAATLHSRTYLSWFSLVTLTSLSSSCIADPIWSSAGSFTAISTGCGSEKVRVIMSEDDRVKC